MTLIGILVGVIIWSVIGCGVLAWIDTDGRLLAWVRSAPNQLWRSFAILCWPILVIAFLWPRR